MSKAGFENQTRGNRRGPRTGENPVGKGWSILKTKIVALTTSLDDLKSSIDTDHDRRR